MPRQPRWMLLAQDAAYHVMSRGYNREAIFADPDDRRYFLGFLARYRERFGFRLHPDRQVSLVRSDANAT